MHSPIISLLLLTFVVPFLGCAGETRVTRLADTPLDRGARGPPSLPFSPPLHREAPGTGG